jgi:hypothetical protein
MSKYLVRDAKITVSRKELMEALDKAGDVVEIEFEPFSLVNVDKVRVGDVILQGVPDVMSHNIVKVPNFKDRVELFKEGDEVMLSYSRELGMLEIIGESGRHHTYVKEIKPPVVYEEEDSWC